MDRIIKFRGKNRKTGKWVYGNLLNPITGPRIVNYTEIDNGSEKRADYHYFDVYEDSIGQFIGLTDCNGKEIYEGDVMEYKNNIGVVTYYNGRGQFQLKVKGQPPITLHNKKGAILGNIHDNPQLLKTKRDERNASNPLPFPG